MGSKSNETLRAIFLTWHFTWLAPYQDMSTAFCILCLIPVTGVGFTMPSLSGMLKRTPNEHLILTFHVDTQMCFRLRERRRLCFLGYLWNSVRFWLTMKVILACLALTTWTASSQCQSALYTPASTLSCTIASLHGRILLTSWLRHTLLVKTSLDTPGVNCIINSVSIFLSF